LELGHVYIYTMHLYLFENLFSGLHDLSAVVIFQFLSKNVCLNVDGFVYAEEQILAEYEARNRFDEEALCSSVSLLTTDELICPVCTK